MTTHDLTESVSKCIVCKIITGLCNVLDIFDVRLAKWSQQFSPRARSRWKSNYFVATTRHPLCTNEIVKMTFQRKPLSNWVNLYIRMDFPSIKCIDFSYILVFFSLSLYSTQHNSKSCFDIFMSLLYVMRSVCQHNAMNALQCNRCENR